MMTYTIDFGFFPMAGLVMSGVLYAVYYWGLRLRCRARWAQLFIVAAIAVTTLATFLTPVPMRMPQSVEERYGASVSRDYLPEEIVYQDVAVPAKKASLLEDRHAATMQKVEEANGHLAEEAVRQSSVALHEMTDNDVELSERAKVTTVLTTDVSPLFGRLYLLGLAVVVAYFLFQLAYLFWFRSSQVRVGRHADGAMIYRTNLQMPFSFGRSVFLPAALDDKVRQFVLMHELSHVRHRHFLWLCGVELLLALNWFNPFVWLFFSEMRLQQEMEVDADVLSSGADREQYQLSLLSVCTQQGKWILTRSAFSVKPLKQRVLFMNATIPPRRARRVLVASAVAASLAIMVGIFVACQANERPRRHTLEGVWEMDWRKVGASTYNEYMGFRQQKYWGHDTELCINYTERRGLCLKNFGMSGMHVKQQGDSLVDYRGRKLNYTLSADGRELESHWIHDVQLPEGGLGEVDNVEHWHRIEPDSDFVRLFLAVATADRDSSRALSGVWRYEYTEIPSVTNEAPHRYSRSDSYLLVNDSIFMNIEYATQLPNSYYGFSANGSCGILSYGPEREVTMNEYAFEMVEAGANRIGLRRKDRYVTVHTSNGKEVGVPLVEYYARAPMPPMLRRMFQPVFDIIEK